MHKVQKTWHRKRVRVSVGKKRQKAEQVRAAAKTENNTPKSEHEKIFNQTSWTAAGAESRKKLRAENVKI